MDYDFDYLDIKTFLKNSNNSVSDIKNHNICYEIPNKIEGTYNDNYNIIYIDEIIRRKLGSEKNMIPNLRKLYEKLEIATTQPQSYIVRENTLKKMALIKEDIENIQSRKKILVYESRVKNIIGEFRKYNDRIITVSINLEKINPTEDEKIRKRLELIESYFEIANEYIEINIIKINNYPNNVCMGCGDSLSKILPTDEGCIRCPNPNCQTEHDTIISNKMPSGSDIHINNYNDESMENFYRAFIRYQGLQKDRPPETIYGKLDEYFQKLGRPTKEEVRNLPLTTRGRRGDTDHMMLWLALSSIGYSNYYKDVNLIGSIYWHWVLPNVMEYKELILHHYNVTQKVYYQIPIEERERDSSLGTSYRLWRHLQLVGHECNFNEFKIVTNNNSLRNHDKLWKLMVEGTNEPDIYYIS